MKTVIVKWGNSQGLRLSKELLETAALCVGDEVSMTADAGGIIIRKVFRHRSLEERLAGYEGGYRSEEWSLGSPVGDEEF